MLKTSIKSLLLTLFLIFCCWLGMSAFQPYNQTFLSLDPASNWVPLKLQQSWQFYKTRFMPGQERVTSNNYGGSITEGQSYALMKAVWMNDPVIFDKTWQWTFTHMKRPDDHLLGWQWGKNDQGQETLLDTNNATDADEDIAYALLLAADKWKQPDYKTVALAMIDDIWTKNVYQAHGRYYLLPGTWEAFSPKKDENGHISGDIVVDPSYLAPYVYRKFAIVDSAHAEGWRQLAKDSYEVLESCSNLTATKLPPNWCAVDVSSGKFHLTGLQGSNSSDFGYDAFRVFWRMGMDVKLDKSEEARAYLKAHDYLYRFWQEHHKLPEGFTTEGDPVGGKLPDGFESSGFAQSALLARQHVLEPEQDIRWYQKLLEPHEIQNADGLAWFNTHNDFLHSVIWLHLYTLQK